jgi:3-hydroxyacyl-[acyl-carrier-protein] dehydratase
MSALHTALRAAASPLEALPKTGPKIGPGTFPGTGGWRREYVFGADSAVFAGHFPGHPVLPAVVQILMAQMTLEDALGGVHSDHGDAGGKPFMLSSVSRAKFMAPLGPSDEIELEVKQGGRPGLWECAVRHAGRTAAQFQLVLDR